MENLDIKYILTEDYENKEIYAFSINITSDMSKKYYQKTLTLKSIIRDMITPIHPELRSGFCIKLTYTDDEYYRADIYKIEKIIKPVMIRYSK